MHNRKCLAVTHHYHVHNRKCLAVTHHYHHSIMPRAVPDLIPGPAVPSSFRLTAESPRLLLWPGVLDFDQAWTAGPGDLPAGTRVASGCQAEVPKTQPGTGRPRNWRSIQVPLEVVTGPGTVARCHVTSHRQYCPRACVRRVAGIPAANGAGAFSRRTEPKQTK